ncbi:hypothetical protein R1sor_006292 [Riccia sorocarpa]|uniref:Cysteine protease n=1 Tax=Riccia sorocarpa TaxID=122646 RepID=A0ABD3HNY5_9MARC
MKTIVVALWVALVAMAATVYALPSRDRNPDISMVTEEWRAQEALASGRFHEILGDSPLVAEFVSFAAKFKKVYNSVIELRYRFQTFVKNVELIEKTNKQGLTYKLGINKFADVSMEEFRRLHLGVKQEDCSATKGTHKVKSNAALPEKRDWRLDGIVSPVKNQQQCGSCWTFSTSGALESAHAQATGHMVLLSEQQLVDCAGAFNNFGCGGGLPSQAFEYIRYNGGLDTEESYPYRAADGVCSFKDSSVGAKVYDVVNITAYNEEELKDAVAFQRPVSIAFEVIDGFNLYTSGVYADPKCRSGPETVNHAVLAVGYDTTGDVPYWIIKNSWGGDWGDGGYFKMEMGKNMCGIATCSSYPVVPEDLLR